MLAPSLEGPGEQRCPRAGRGARSRRSPQQPERTGTGWGWGCSWGAGGSAEAEAAREDVRMAGQRHGSPKRQRVDVPPGDVTKPSGSDFTNCFICEDVVKTQSHCSLRRRKLNCCFKMDLFSEALLRVRGRAAVRLLPRVKLRTGRPREGFPVSLCRLQNSVSWRGGGLRRPRCLEAAAFPSPPVRLSHLGGVRLSITPGPGPGLGDPES